MKRDTLHLTLAFLGNVPAERLDLVLAAAGQVRGQAFDMVLDHVECWRHNHIVWMGPANMPPGLARLAADLSSELGQAGFALEKRAFAAHITLLRNARCPESLAGLEPILWQAREFVLVESQLAAEGARYQIVASCPLQERASSR